MAHPALVDPQHRVDAADDPADVWETAGGLLTRTVSALDPRDRLSRSSLLPGAQHSAPAGLLAGHGGWRDVDRHARCPMISRHCKGIVKQGCADAYLAHLERETFPSLRRLA